MLKRQIFVFTVLFSFLFSSCFVVNALAMSYEVKKGDNLFSIAKKFGISVQEVKKTNNLKGNSLKPTQVLNIPEKNSAKAPAKTVTKADPSKAKPTAYYTVRKGDTIGTIARKTGVSQNQIIAMNNLHAKKLRIGQRLVLVKSSRLREKGSLQTEDKDLLNEDDEDDVAENDQLTQSDAEKEKQRTEELLGKWNSPNERQLFVKVATGFLGAPYRLGGSTVRGIDCSAFVRKIYQFFDITLPRTAREQSEVGLSVDKGELTEGDLVFFHTRRPVGHVGIYIGNNEFVHASSRSRVVRIDSLETPYFQKRFVRAIRVKGLDNNNASNDHGA